MDNLSWISNFAYDEWVAAPTVGSLPLARYKHAAAVIHEKLFVFGGSHFGRLLSDLQVLDLRNLSWSCLKLDPAQHADQEESNGQHDSLPGISGHCLIPWGDKLLLLSGNCKKPSDKMIVWSIDVEAQCSVIINTSGTAPIARGGFSATVFESRLIIFGGEDRNRRLLNDVFSLNLETMTWDCLEITQTPPAPRYDHTASLHSQRYLMIFGGCSHSLLFGDLHVLDLETLEWSKADVLGDLLTPRAGHAGVAVDDNWYIVGGGDNEKGCWETFVLNMSTLVSSKLTSVNPRNPLASEGMTVSLVCIDGESCLVAFGGYNGKYSNETFFMRLKKKGTVQPKIFESPAAAAAAASVTAAYAFAKSGSLGPSMVSHITDNNDSEVDVIRHEMKKLQLSRTEIEAENSRLKGKLDELNISHSELSKELTSVQGQLVAERSRCFKLEAQVVELQKELRSFETIENNVKLLLQQKSVHDKPEQTNGSENRETAGMWRWMQR